MGGDECAGDTRCLAQCTDQHDLRRAQCKLFQCATSVLTQHTRSLAAEAANTTLVAVTCDPEDANNCYLGSATPNRTWAVIGDDTIGPWLPALQDITTQRPGLRIQVFRVSNCTNSLDEAGLPALGESGTTQQMLDACIAMHTAALSYISANQVQVVALVDNSRLLGGTRQNRYTGGLAKMVSAVQKHARTAVLGQVPSWNVTPAACFNPDLTNVAGCYGKISSNSTSVSAMQTAVAQTKAPYIDPRLWLCSGNLCPLFVGDTIVTLDGYRLTAGIAKNLSDVLYENLNKGARR